MPVDLLSLSPPWFGDAGVQVGDAAVGEAVAYRGHAATKSRSYSVTYGELRSERKAHQEAERRQAEGLPAHDEREVVVDAKWRFSGSGLARGEEKIVDGIRASQQLVRSIGAD